MLRLRRFAPLMISLAVLFMLAALQARDVPAFRTLRNLVFDAYQQWLPRPYRDEGVRIVDIDEASLQRLGQWPWPRTRIAALAERLAKAGASSIAFDMIFAEPDRTSPGSYLRPWMDRPEVMDLLQNLPDNDQELARVIRSAPVVTGFALTPDATDGGMPAVKAGIAFAGEPPVELIRDFQGAVSTLPELEAGAKGNGALNVVPGSDGKIRRVPLLLRMGDQIYPSLVAESARVREGARGYQIRGEPPALRMGSLTVPLSGAAEIWIHYTKPGPTRYLPAWRVLAQEFDPAIVKGGLVLIGTSAIGLQDPGMNALGHIVPGIEIHAQALEQILAGYFLIRPSWARGAEILIPVLVALVVLVLVQIAGGVRGGLFALSAIGLGFAGSVYAFAEYRLLLDPLSGSLAVVAVYLIGMISKQLIVERQRRWVQRAFASYVSPKLVDYLVHNPDQLALGGQRRDCSFIFTDLAGFTPMMESLDPEDLTALINEYLSHMAEIVFRHDGMVDRFVGDAVTVMFSAPVEQPDHRCRAIACAMEIDRWAESFRAGKQAEGVPFGSTRIGVHSGEVIVGNFGGGLQLDYRAFGDPINTAARLESANRSLGTRVCVSADTAGGCPEFAGRPVGELVLKGKQKAVFVYEPVDPMSADSDQVAGYRRAYEMLEARDPAAREAFAELIERDANDALARFHLARLEHGETGSRIVLTQK